MHPPKWLKQQGQYLQNPCHPLLAGAHQGQLLWRTQQFLKRLTQSYHLTQRFHSQGYTQEK